MAACATRRALRWPDLQRAAWAADPLLQRAKSDEQRSTKRRRIHKALRTIGLLGRNIKAGLDRHVFDALPVSKALDKADPTGLHAYRNGRLPAGITGTVTGNPNKVHHPRREDLAEQGRDTVYPEL